jgi:hypothetical protein
MPTIVIKSTDILPVGLVANAYIQRKHPERKEGAFNGPADGSATVAADGSLTLTLPAGDYVIQHPATKRMVWFYLQ